MKGRKNNGLMAKQATASLIKKLKGLKGLRKNEPATTLPNNIHEFDTDLYKGLLAFVLIVNLLLQIFLLNYIYKLETTGCECAKGWRRSFIKYYLIVLVVFTIAQVFVITMDGVNSLFALNIAFSGIMFIFGLCFAIITLQYVHTLKKTKCECSNTLARTVLNLVALIDIIVYIWVILSILAAIIMALIYGK